jgi:hypothetical protein
MSPIGPEIGVDGARSAAGGVFHQEPGRGRQADRSTRLTMLETIRHFACQQLEHDSERDVVHQRHFEHYLALVELTVPRLATREEPTALAILDGDLDNLSAALQWALDTAPALALRLAGLLGDYWTIRLDQQGLRWLEATLAAAGEEAPSHERASAHLHRGILLGHRHGGTARLHAVTQALSLYRQANDHAGTSAALVVLARASLIKDQPRAGRPCRFSPRSRSQPSMRSHASRRSGTGCRSAGSHALSCAAW